MTDGNHNRAGAERQRSPESACRAARIRGCAAAPPGLVTLLALAATLLGSVTLHAQPHPRYATQLARECDELLALVVKRPYGWAWTEGEPDRRPKGGAQAVTLDPPGTAGAGFVLYWAGDLLDNAKYKEAAYQAARGITAAQRPTGAVPARPTFQPATAGGHDAAVIVADRAPAYAALGLTLCLLDESGGKDEALRRAASRTITWLLKQQTPVGGWPQGYPPTTAPKDAVRLTRLDAPPDYRNAVFAMLLAHDVLGDDDKLARMSVERSITVLLRMRIGSASPIGGPLWATAYGLDAFPTDRVLEFRPGIDVLASRNAMQAIIAAYLMLGDPPPRGEEHVSWSQSLSASGAAVEKLPKYDGKWLRIYDYEIEQTQPPPSTQPTGFSTTAPVIPPAQQTGTWGMDKMVENVQTVTDVGRERFIAALAANLSLRQRLAAALCGLDDDPLSPDLPVTDDELREYLKTSDARFRVLEGPTPATLADRLRRLYLLLIRAKLEQRLANAK
jgi:hypothetical protein